MAKSIWYISKYVSPPAKASAGSRGYMLMRELVRMGYRCLIITSDSNRLAEVPELSSRLMVQEVEGVRICWLRTMKYSVAKSVRRILSWLDFEWRVLRLPKQDFDPPDVVIVSSLSLLTILNGFLLRRRYGCRLVFEIRDIWPLTITEEGGFSRWNPFVLLLGWVERLGYQYADAIVGTMPNLGEHVSRVLGFPKEVGCIPMGIDLASLDNVEEIPEDYVRKYIPQGKFVVAHAGTIGITNALDIFFECAESLAANETIHFLMVGEGDLRGAFEEKYSHLRNLTFAPRVPKRMVQSVLTRCDLLYFSVHMSKVWQYGQSLNKVIDYMVAGKPVVASYSGYPSMINESGCGTYVTAGDVTGLRNEILRYSNMPKEERGTVGACGRAWVIENRNFATLAVQYLEVMFPSGKHLPEPL